MDFILNIISRFIEFVRRSFSKIEKLSGVEVPYALPLKSFGYKDEYCWEDYYTDYNKKTPIKFFIFKTFKDALIMFLKRYLEDPLIWFNYRFIEKHHIVDIRNVMRDLNGLPYKGGHAGIEFRMKAAIVSLFKDFANESFKIYQKSFQERYDELKESCDEFSKFDFESQSKRLLVFIDIQNFFDKVYPERLDLESLGWGNLPEKGTEERKEKISLLRDMGNETERMLNEYLSKIFENMNEFWI